MAESVYECMFLFNANAYARNPGGAPAAVEELVKTVDGEILASRLFDERKLAYPIKNQRKGVYWLTYAKMETTSLPKFNRACQLKDMVLRHMVVNIDPRLVDTMVAVARGEAPAVVEEEVEAKQDGEAEKTEAAPAT